MIENILHIGLKEIINKTEDLQIDENKTKTIKNIVLSIPTKEYEKIENATNELAQLIYSKEFRDLLRTSLGSDKKVVKYCEQFYPLLNVTAFRDKKSKPKKTPKEDDGEPKKGFFTKELERTPELESLEENIGIALDIITIPKIKSLLNTYKKSSITEDGGYLPDEILIKASKNVFEHKLYTSEEWDKLSFTAIKNIINWTAEN